MAQLKDRLREAMRDADMKATDLSKLTGIDKGSISHYLSGQYEPKQRNIQKICKVLRVSDVWLMGFDVDKQRESDEDRQRKSETMENEMRDRMLEHICQIFKEADFSKQIRMYEAIRKIEMEGKP